MPGYGRLQNTNILNKDVLQIMKFMCAFNFHEFPKFNAQNVLDKLLALHSS
jgi:hypothetical protein